MSPNHLPPKGDHLLGRDARWSQQAEVIRLFGTISFWFGFNYRTEHSANPLPIALYVGAQA
ncbi:MAG: hypothetical protein PSV13_16930 [Lacunisphaera sp.]|nr:hypothetical protein [Lacunisphaera sp.]